VFFIIYLHVIIIIIIIITTIVILVISPLNLFNDTFDVQPVSGLLTQRLEMLEMD